MEKLYELEKRTSRGFEAVLDNGHFVVGTGDEGIGAFPSSDGSSMIEIDKVRVKKISCFEARLRPYNSQKGSYNQANDKIFFEDIDTECYYSMDVGDLFNLMKGLEDGTAKVDKKGVFTCKVFPFTRGGTTFLSVLTKDLERKIKKNNERKKKEEKNKLKMKDLVPGNVYSDGYFKFIYLGKGEIESEILYKRTIYSKNIEDFDTNYNKKGHIFVSLSDYERNKYLTDEEFDKRIIDIKAQGTKTLVKDLGKYEKSIKEIKEELMKNNEKRIEEYKKDGIRWKNYVRYNAKLKAPQMLDIKEIRIK